MPESYLLPSDQVLSIHSHCRDLVFPHSMKETEVFCCMFIKEDDKYVEFDRTEGVSPNSAWLRVFQALFIFELSQPIRFCIFPVGVRSVNLESSDLIGYVDTTVQNLGCHLSEDMAFDLKRPDSEQKTGVLVLNTEQNPIKTPIFEFIFHILESNRVRFFHRNHHYFTVSRVTEGGRMMPVYKSECACKGSSSKFKRVRIPLDLLCNNDHKYPLLFSIFDSRSSTSDPLVSSFEMNVDSIISGVNTPFDIKDSTGKAIGKVIFKSAEIFSRPTLCDYMKAGLQINMITAIDFTGSNGPPSTTSSLHHVRKEGLNQYEKCMLAVGQVLCPYDSDQQFPVFGFGGIYKRRTSHCFPLNENDSDPSIFGLDGILSTYREKLKDMSLSGPTNFEGIIRESTRMAQESFQQNHTYAILLILTDGEISDMSKTIDAIVEASDAPISIIIVGVGDSEFDSMDRLDADVEPLKHSNGTFMKRDIVQFVPFNKFKLTGEHALAAEVLAELPFQVDEFCRTHGFLVNQNNE